MIRKLVHWALLAMALLPGSGLAEPIKLKLSMFTSDRALVYVGGVKPFVDAVNTEAKGLLEIEVHFSGELGKDPAKQAQLVTDGTADLAIIFPDYGPERFADNAVIELPGLFQDAREASMVFTRLIAAGALQGYEDFHVVGAYASPPETIHSRLPVASLADLKGKRMRVSNATEMAALQRLGVQTVTMPLTTTLEAIGSGSIDGAVLPPAMLFEFGVGRVSSHHYMLNISVASLALVMSRKKFDSLPEPAQDIIRRHSGQRPSESFADAFSAVNDRVVEQLTANSHRTIVYPSPTDLDTAKAAFKAVVDEWAAKSPHNQRQLEIVQSEIARLRASQ